MRGAALVIPTLLAAASVAAGQTSTSYRLEEHVLNAGGNPAGGVVLTSGSYHITLDSVGEAIAGASLSSASFSMESGFGAPYLPPGEVLDLALLADDQTLTWSAERSAGTYNVYRDLLSGIAGTDLGDCFQQGLAATTATDAGTPPSQDGYSYLVTVDNRLGEEGTLGIDGGGVVRNNLLGTPCP